MEGASVSVCVCVCVCVCVERGGGGGGRNGGSISECRERGGEGEIPSLSPPGWRALLSPGHVFLFTVTLISSRTFSTRSPSKPWRERVSEGGREGENDLWSEVKHTEVGVSSPGNDLVSHGDEGVCHVL